MDALAPADADLVKTAQVTALRRLEQLRHGELAAHEASVARICAILCVAIGLDEHFKASLTVAAELHDIGKLAIADRLLQKPATLSRDEMSVMRTHTQLGHDILRGTGDPVLDFAATIALSHHENFDGSGYPKGLRGEAIPLGSRIVSLCDVYDALRADRIYRAGMTHHDAVSVITGPDGRASRQKFDPMVLDAFVRCGPAIASIYQA
jgi:putative two-component system response regulator